MKSSERIKKVYEREIEFIDSLTSACAEFLITNECMQAAADILGVDVPKALEERSFNKYMAELLPALKEKVEFHSFINSYMDKHSREAIINSATKSPYLTKKYSPKEIKEAIYMGDEVFSTFTYMNSMVEYMQNLAFLRQTINVKGDPIELFHQIEQVNAQIMFTVELLGNRLGSEEIAGLLRGDIVKYLENMYKEGFGELFSVDALREELAIEAEAQRKIEIERKVEQERKAESQQLNDRRKNAQKDVDNLQQTSFCGDEILAIMQQLDEFDQTFLLPFGSDMSREYINYANAELALIELDIESVKQKIAAALAYAGEDIKDVLREKHSYQIREYVEKLKTMSGKYGTKFAEFSNPQAQIASEALVEADSKAQAMYKLIEEMKANSFVVDMARFSK